MSTDYTVRLSCIVDAAIGAARPAELSHSYDQVSLRRKGRLSGLDQAVSILVQKSEEPSAHSPRLCITITQADNTAAASIGLEGWRFASNIPGISRIEQLLDALEAFDWKA